MQIYSRDAILYVDVNCYKCKKLCALPNTTEIDGRKYCYHCVDGIYNAVVSRISPKIQLICVGCNKTPNQLDEYIGYAEDAGMTPDEYVWEEEGTLNTDSGSFFCTSCYIKAGCPSTPKGWTV